MRPTVLVRSACRWVLAALIFCAGPPAGLAGPNNLATAPDWTLHDLDGHAVRLNDFRGKVVLLDFWATWCPPCRKEIPVLIELQKKYGPRGLVVIGVSLDENPGQVGPFARQFGINYIVVAGTPLVAASYGNVAVIPTAFVINKEGKIVALHEGEVKAATFETEIIPLF